MKLQLFRAHAESEFAIKHKDKAFAVDIHKCLLFLIKTTIFGRKKIVKVQPAFTAGTFGFAIE